ncbi:hypothetical protein BGZ58_008475 [Dissophora ornata]|nr:hypothetical protein BGZ58_008475 [Dissophora ornata]
MEEFLTLYEASTWPELDSISFKGDDLRISNESHCRLLRAAKKPLRRIDASTIGVEETTYNLLRSRHFATIEIIDFFNANFVKQEWINEVLTSCPNLQKFRAKSIRAQDMLRSPWVCLGLQRLVVFIDMGFPDHGSYRKLTEEELGQCRAVYKQLAALKELRVLDTLTSYGPLCAYSGVVYNDPSHPRHLLVPLPVRLEAGLDLLATSKKLEMVLFWGGRHVVHKKTLIWMVDNWKLLKYLCGRWRIREGSYNEVKDRYFWSGQLQKWLAQHGIRTEGSHYEQAPSDEYDVADCGNCCALSDDEEETGGD